MSLGKQLTDSILKEGERGAWSPYFPYRPIRFLTDHWNRLLTVRVFPTLQGDAWHRGNAAQLWENHWHCNTWSCHCLQPCGGCLRLSLAVPTGSLPTKEATYDLDGSVSRQSMSFNCLVVSYRTSSKICRLECIANVLTERPTGAAIWVEISKS